MPGVPTSSWTEVNRVQRTRLESVMLGVGVLVDLNKGTKFEATVLGIVKRLLSE